MLGWGQGHVNPILRPTNASLMDLESWMEETATVNQCEQGRHIEN